MPDEVNAIYKLPGSCLQLCIYVSTLRFLSNTYTFTHRCVLERRSVAEIQWSWPVGMFITHNAQLCVHAL